MSKRSFTVVNMSKSDGCATKFHGGRYLGRGAAAAARKALSYHCSVKRIRGRCAFYIKLRETTRGSAGKHYTYLAHRVKLETPVVRVVDGKKFTNRYTTKVQSVAGMPTKCRTGRQKTRGSMRSRRGSHLG